MKRMLGIVIVVLVDVAAIAYLVRFFRRSGPAPYTVDAPVVNERARRAMLVSQDEMTAEFRRIQRERSQS